jgi:CDP-4-dehydro-6-deoxyglucose reductase, E3
LVPYKRKRIKRGKLKITINNERFFEASPDLSILESARNGSIAIDYSCLSGRCSECKVRVVSGDFEMSSTQEGLNDKEVQEGYCLSCITKPLSDMELEEVSFIEGVLPETKTIPAKISLLEFLSEDVVKVNLRTPPNKSLEFLAGQYIDLSIKGIKRSYSIASTPSDSEIEMLIKNYNGGQFSNYLFNYAKVNDLLRIEGPKGTYVFPKDIPQNVLFISTGTGIAPNLSLIKSALKEGRIKSSQIILIHGERFAKEHIYSIEETLNEIEIIKCTSREFVEGYVQGYVQDAVKGLDLNMSNSLVFACGNPQMIKELKIQMLTFGLEEKNFKSDAFVPSN